MSKIKDNILQFEEQTNTQFEDTEEFRNAYEQWEFEKLYGKFGKQVQNMTVGEALCQKKND